MDCKEVFSMLMFHAVDSRYNIYATALLDTICTSQGFTSLSPSVGLGGKYNTLPGRQVAIIEAVYNQEQAPLIPAATAATAAAGPKSILVKKVGVDMGGVYCLYNVSLLELETRAIQRFAKISQSQRRPLLGVFNLNLKSP